MLCRACGKEIKEEDLSRHSPMGHHLPCPDYIELHDKCHKLLHENPNWFYSKLNQKWLKELEDEELSGEK